MAATLDDVLTALNAIKDVLDRIYAAQTGGAGGTAPGGVGAGGAGGGGGAGGAAAPGAGGGEEREAGFTAVGGPIANAAVTAAKEAAAAFGVEASLNPFKGVGDMNEAAVRATRNAPEFDTTQDLEARRRLAVNEANREARMFGHRRDRAGLLPEISEKIFDDIMHEEVGAADEGFRKGTAYSERIAEAGGAPLPDEQIQQSIGIYTDRARRRIQQRIHNETLRPAIDAAAIDAKIDAASARALQTHEVGPADAQKATNK